ncbi:MAG: NAD(P)-dependent oxidoreductase [Alphaproteobacteria bacterium]
MTLLVTGGGGFVMSNLTRKWLEQLPEERAVVLDSGPEDEALNWFFAPVSDRVEYVRGSVLDTALLDQLAARHGFTRIVHGATVTLFAPETPDGKEIGNPETDSPDKVLEVNFMGTVRLLELARRCPNLKCFINISSGDVYSDDGPTPPGPMPEDGWVEPPEFYGISKYAAELTAKRYGKLFGLNVASCRLSGVYGPMDRWRPSRAYQCPPYVAIHRALEGQTVRINAPEAVKDHIYVGDVADAVISLMRKEAAFDHSAYNIALGQAVTLQELLATIQQIIPALRWEVRPESECDIIMNRAHKHGRWGAYDTGRLRSETGWQPRPLHEALAEYVAFIRETPVSD